jgi:hypothetical protein
METDRHKSRTLIAELRQGKIICSAFFAREENSSLVQTGTEIFFSTGLFK